MLDMGFIPDIRKIIALLPAKRQNLLLSATFPDEIRKLAASFMRDPVTIEVAPRNRPVELISQVAYAVGRERKRDLLAHLVTTGNWSQVLVFTRTKHGANRLAHHLGRAGIQSDAIHGNKSQGARTRALQRFKANELRVLVATDIAARGLDIEDLPHVVNFDLPHVAEDYVHRIGRTGRAGATGEAVSLVSHEERPLLAAIERLVGRKIEQRTAEAFAGRPASEAPADHPVEPEERQPVLEASPGNHGENGGRKRRRRRRRGDGGAMASDPRHGQQPNQRHGQQPRRDASQQPGERHRQHANRFDEQQPRDNGNRMDRQPRDDGNRFEQQPRHDSNRFDRQPRHGGNRMDRQARRDGNGSRKGEPRRPQERQAPRVAGYGQFAPQQANRQPVPPGQPQAQNPADDERQPPPEKAKNQLFPAFFGLFNRKQR